MNVSLSYDYWSLRKGRKKSGNFWVFLRKKFSFFAKKVYFYVAHTIAGVWAHFRSTHYSWALSDIFGVFKAGAIFFSFGNVNFLINLKVFAYFRLINELDTSWNLFFFAELLEASKRSYARSRRAMAVAPMFFQSRQRI